MKNIISDEDKRRETWEFAFGIMKIEDMVPSDILKKLAEKEIAGEITTEEILEIILNNYKVSEEHDRYIL